MTNFEEELERTGYLVYTNKGVSMMPLLREGRDVMIIRARRTGFQRNDAVIFKRDNGQYVLHRITKRLPDGRYFIIGDHCIGGELVQEDHILGVLSEVRRDGRTIRVTDFGYRLYVLTVPLRRFVLRARIGVVQWAVDHIYGFPRKVLQKVYHFIKSG